MASGLAPRGSLPNLGQRDGHGAPRLLARLPRLAAAAPLLLAACTAAAPPPAPPPPPPPPRTLVLAAAQSEAVADLLRMEDRRALELERWTALARDPEPFIRARAALAAGRVADPQTRAQLLAVLADTSEAPRAAAVFALGRLADTTMEVTGALAAALLRSDSASLEAPLALARQNTRAAYDALWQRLNALRAATGVGERALARECLLALWRFRERPGAAELADSYAGSPDPAVRWAAAYLLMRAGSAGNVGRLLALLGDPDPLVRATAARALRRGAADSAGSAPAVRAGLQRLLADAHPHVRINATRALAAFRDPADATALLPLLADVDGNVRLAAAEALASYRHETARGPLIALVADTAADLALRAAALASFARSDTALAVRNAGDWAGAASWLQRLYAVRAMAGVAWPEKAELVQRLSRDPDPRVQGEAFGALAAADSTLPLAALFLEGLASRDPVVRAGAAAGLGKRRDPAFLSALMQAYDRARSDTINDAALAAVDALAQLGERGVPVTAGFFLRFRPATDPIVRSRVAQRFGTGEGSWGEARPIAAERNIGFYRQVVQEGLAPVLAGAPPPMVRLRTERGDIVLALDPVAAPLTVHNFLELIRSGFYASPELRWHRVVPNFVLQDGDPRGDGSGGPRHVIRDELNLLRYQRLALGMALSGPDTGGSQFFITHSPQPHLDGGYTIFGRVAEGSDVVDAIVQDDRILAIEVMR